MDPSPETNSAVAGLAHLWHQIVGTADLISLDYEGQAYAREVAIAADQGRCAVPQPEEFLFHSSCFLPNDVFSSRNASACSARGAPLPDLLTSRDPTGRSATWRRLLRALLQFASYGVPGDARHSDLPHAAPGSPHPPRWRPHKENPLPAWPRRYNRSAR